MALTISHDLEADELARHLSNDPQELLDLLAHLAGGFDDAAAFTKQVAEWHSGALAHRTVAPFLRLLADRLEAVEAGMAEADARRAR